MTLQTIVSREVNPMDPAVVTVGTFHAGTKRNIIANDATIELTVRSYKPEVQKQLLTAIERIAKAEAAAAGAPREPTVTVDPREASEVVYNAPALAARLTTCAAAWPRRGECGSNRTHHGLGGLRPLWPCRRRTVNPTPHRRRGAERLRKCEGHWKACPGTS